MNELEKARVGTMMRAGGVNKVSRYSAEADFGVSNFLYDLISYQEQGLDYVRKLFRDYLDKTWIETKTSLKLNEFCRETGLRENDLKELWKDEIKQTEIENKRAKEEYHDQKVKEDKKKYDIVPEYLNKILKDKELFNKITENELDKKIVGEIESRKVIFLAAQGRLVKNCQIASFNLLVNDEAGAGKDYVTHKTLELVPKEYYIHKTRISPAVFTYWHNKEYEPDWTWDGKVFYPEDISEQVLNSDVFKVMCSSGSSATIVIKQRAIDIEIEGKPVMITTTATATPNPELTRRFQILNLDSSENQTEAIMKRHSKFKKEGIIPEYNKDFIEAQRYLKRVDVKIPFAELIDKHFPKSNIIMRTLYPRFLDYISASCAFHQYQRTHDEGFFLAEGQDYDIARKAFMKLTSNKYMIPLTRNQKAILSVFENEPKAKLSASQTLPLMKGIISTIATMQTQLHNLVKYGLLIAEVGQDNYGRDLEVFSLAKGISQNEKVEIPTFDELCRLIEVSEVSEVSIISKVSEVSPIIKEDGLDGLDTSDGFSLNEVTQRCTHCNIELDGTIEFMKVLGKPYCLECHRKLIWTEQWSKSGREAEND